jgi:hypothetical protein
VKEREAFEKETRHCLSQKTCKLVDRGGYNQVVMIEGEKELQHVRKTTKCVEAATCEASLVNDWVTVLPVKSLHDCLCKEECYIDSNTGEVRKLYPFATITYTKFPSFHCPKK